MSVKRLLSIFVVLVVMASMAMAADFPTSTRFTVRISNELSSGTSKAGDTFEGVLAKDVVASNGNVLARAGAPVKGKVVSAKSSGRLKAPGIIGIRLTSVDGKAVNTVAVYRKGKSHTKSNATKIGGGAAAGAVIGALAGGGKGAAIGALAGGAAGTGVAAYTGKMEAVIPAESTFTFTSTAR